MDIGKKLKNLRNQCGLTQEELADRAELSKGYISQLEHNMTSPSIATLADILQCLGSSLEEFFTGTSEEQVVFGEEEYFEKIDNEMIMELHLEGKSDVEIAKLLGCGLGEVRLVIGLHKGENR